MALQVWLLRETLSADFAFVGSHAVQALVSTETAAVREALVTSVTLVRSVPSVVPHVDREIDLLSKDFSADFALVGALLVVYALVVVETGDVREALATDGALVGLLSLVHLHVCDEPLLIKELLSAVLAVIDALSRACLGAFRHAGLRDEGRNNGGNDHVHRSCEGGEGGGRG